MRYNQVKDLVEWAAGYHGHMARQYRAAADSSESQRLAMALTYLADSELRMKTGLEALFNDGSDHKEVLEIWFDDPSDFPQPPMLEALVQQTVADSIDELTHAAVESHSKLQSLYEHRASRSKIEPEETFFNSLAEGHNAEARKLVVSMQEFEDI
ncbi:2-hydroxyacyl-CoA dehydratase [Vreelandella andesensis]|uniref:2-hydroxyacyl-CoA dehydratase n=1 Tax=Vreelandella andesensis TaxID=447567 RepID=A0A433KTG4_9GAMM|nr:2-hydroxyacyl-CoA dehydratase [Halomonas andesensis]RUR32876.1 2-hydroxyacyl-CoA dehydratase [Halomonas andesensis]